jgi:hypothetical protein
MIDQWLNKLDNLNTKNLFWVIVAASILLAAWMQYIQHGWINPDSVLYFEQAKLFAQGEWKAGFKIFEWPLYGVCISLVHNATSLPIQNSAQLLNMLFFGIATASFLKLIQLAGGSNRTLFFGMLLLFSSLYIVGDVLEMLMRDEGYWAFYLTALVYFIRYLDSEKLSHAVLWQLSMMTATLFRIEGILFLLFLPLIVIALQHENKRNKLVTALKAYSVCIIIGLSIVMTIVLHPDINMASFGRLDEVFTLNLFDEFTKKFLAQADIMSKDVLGGYLEEFAIPGLLLTFLYVIGSKILTAAGLVGAALAIFGIKNTSKTIPPKVRQVLLTSSAIALIVTYLIITKVFVLSSRYVVTLAWILLVFATIYLANLSSNTHKNKRRFFVIISFILCLGFVKNILPKREGYNYAQEAIAWIKSYNKSGKVFYEDSRLRYYAAEPFIGSYSFNWENLNANNNIKETTSYDYFVINFNKHDKNKKKLIEESLLNYKEIKRFYAEKNKKYIAIYQNSVISNQEREQ